MHERMDSEDPLFLLYTSGNTGLPKGLVHTHAGYLLYASLTQQAIHQKYHFAKFLCLSFITWILISLRQMVFNHEENDVFGCMADIGWIAGHSYVVYGPLCNGATTVLFESAPTYPNPGTFIVFQPPAKSKATSIHICKPILTQF